MMLFLALAWTNFQLGKYPFPTQFCAEYLIEID